MPAAYYDFNIEQSSDFVSGFKILKPDNSGLFKFIPNPNQPFWTNNTLNIDVPNEIKLLYPNNENSFGYLQGTQLHTFLIIRMGVKNSSGTQNIKAETTYVKNANSTFVTETITYNPTAGATIKPAFFTINPPSSNLENNVTLNIPSGSTNYKGRYVYDIELEYKIGGVGATSGQTTPFVIRLLQGRAVFSPNITT